jgi:xanthosine phosphorylase
MPTTLEELVAVVDRHIPKDFFPKIGIILGSGLSSIAEEIEQVASIPYQALPGIHSGTVAGHASILVCGYLNGIPIVCLRGRLHLYEGVSYQSIRLLVRLVKHLGCHAFIITAAAGSLNPEVTAGEVMMITDHINTHPGNPLVGPNDESIGPRFISMEGAYDLGLQDSMRAAARKLTIQLHEGVYLSTLGPSFETPAEIRAYQRWGADAVGMSVVPEVILARHCGMRVAGIAAITNLAAGLSPENITHEGTLHFGEIAARKLAKLIPMLIADISHGLV